MKGATSARCRSSELRRGMRLLIKPGAQFPVDAEIAKGADG